MKDEMEKFLKNKKNRKILFFLIGAIILYLYVKKKSTADNESVGYAGLKYTNGGVTGGVVLPTTPVVEIPSSYTGNYAPELVYSMHPQDGMIRVTGSSRNWRIFDDSTTINLPSDKEFLYIVGVKNIRQSTPLQNEIYQSNNDFVIEKWIIKKNAPNLSYWWYATDNWGDKQGRSALAKSEAAFALVHFRKVA